MLFRVVEAISERMGWYAVRFANLHPPRCLGPLRSRIYWFYHICIWGMWMKHVYTPLKHRHRARLHRENQHA